MLPHLAKENRVSMSPKRMRNAEVSPQQNRPDAKPNTTYSVYQPSTYRVTISIYSVSTTTCEIDRYVIRWAVTLTLQRTL